MFLNVTRSVYHHKSTSRMNVSQPQSAGTIKSKTLPQFYFYQHEASHLRENQRRCTIKQDSGKWLASSRYEWSVCDSLEVKLCGVQWFGELICR